MDDLYLFEIDLPVFRALSALAEGGEVALATAVAALRREFGFEWLTAVRYYRQWTRIGRRVVEVLA